MLEVADFIARHVVAVLALLAFLLLLLAAVFWHLLLRWAPLAWNLVGTFWPAVRGSGVGRRVREIPLVGPTLRQSMSVLRFLGLYAVLAFAAAAFALAAFFEVADEIGVGESLASFDMQLSAALARHVPGTVLQAFAWITRLGDTEFLLALGAVVALALIWLRRWQLAAAWSIATLSGGILVRVLKAAYGRTRPVHDHGYVVETGWSFPSGHASGSMLVYGLLGYLLVRHTSARWHLPIVLAATLMIAFVGSSRVVLQVHFLSDVIAGYICAAAWIALCIAGLEAWRWQEARTAQGAVRTT